MKYTPFAERDAVARAARVLQDRGARRRSHDLRRAAATTSRSCRRAATTSCRYMVQLQRKVAFPFVTLIMTLLAVPFAVTTGRRGAIYGIGVGIVLALVYWTMLSIFGALGAGGCDVADARGLGAEHPLRRRRGLHAADRPHLTCRLRQASITTHRCSAALRDPDPSRVARLGVRRRRPRTGWCGSGAWRAATVCVAPTGVKSSKKTVRSWSTRVDVDRPLPALADAALIVARAAGPRSASGCSARIGERQAIVRPRVPRGVSNASAATWPRRGTAGKPVAEPQLGCRRPLVRHSRRSRRPRATSGRARRATSLSTAVEERLLPARRRARRRWRLPAIRRRAHRSGCCGSRPAASAVRPARISTQ